MAKIISLGEYNSLYKYIWFYVISRLVYAYFFNYKTIPLTFKPEKLRLDSFPNSTFTKELMDYLIMFIFSYILLKYETWKIKKDCNKSSLNEKKITKNKNNINSLIYNKMSNNFTMRYTFFIFIILLVLSNILINNYYIIGLSGLDFWIFELIFISLINNMIFNYQIYKNQKLAIYFIIIICSILTFLSIINIFNDDQQDTIYKEYIWITPLAIIGFILIIFIKSFTYCKAKYYFDYKYLSVFKFLISVGIIGTIICLIATIISSNIVCVKKQQFKYINSICKLYDSEKKIKYYDNIIVFFRELYKNDKIFKGAYLILFFIKNINTFLTNLFTFLIIKYLSPEYCVISTSIYYLALEIFRFIDYLITRKYKNFSIYNILSELFAIIGGAIYLEFIELNFFGLNYHLKKSISNRSRRESSQIQELSELDGEIDDELE